MRRAEIKCPRTAPGALETHGPRITAVGHGRARPMDAESAEKPTGGRSHVPTFDPSSQTNSPFAPTGLCIWQPTQNVAP